MDYGMLNFVDMENVRGREEFIFGYDFTWCHGNWCLSLTDSLHMYLHIHLIIANFSIHRLGLSSEITQEYPNKSGKLCITDVVIKIEV